MLIFQCIEVLELQPTSYEEDDDLYEDSCVVECVFNNTGTADLEPKKLVNQVMAATKDIPTWFMQSKEIVEECLAESKLLIPKAFFAKKGFFLLK